MDVPQETTTDKRAAVISIKRNSLALFILSFLLLVLACATPPEVKQLSLVAEPDGLSGSRSTGVGEVHNDQKRERGCGAW